MSNVATPAAELPVTGFVRLPTILGTDDRPGVFPVGKTTWYKGIREGRYPAPVKLGPRSSAWRAEEIRELIAERSSTSMKRAVGVAEAGF